MNPNAKRLKIRIVELKMYTKEQQTFKNKAPKISKEEKAYLSWLNDNRDSKWPTFTPRMETVMRKIEAKILEAEK